MSGYTYQQLEVIRERARGIGLRAEFSARTASEDPCLVVLVNKFDSISYFTDLARLTSILIYGGATPLAEEMDQIHATLTSGAAFAPVEPGSGRSCDVCSMGRLPAGCELIGCAEAPL
jgi:hypothetical protein